MRIVAAALLMALALAAAPDARAQQGQDLPLAEWWAEEQECLDNCPKLPRFSGTETDAEYRERMRQTDLYNACQRRCTQEYMHKVRPPYEGFDDGSESYFKRNRIQEGQ